MEKFMKRMLFAGLIVVLLAGCSTFGSKKDEQIVDTKFMGGEMKISYTWSGELKAVESSGTGKVVSNSPGAVDEAYLVATLRARQQIAEFMRLDLDSEKFKKSVFESLQEAETETRQPVSNNVKSKIVTSVQEDIRQKSTAIMRGTYVSDKVYDNNTKTVKVTVRFTPEDLAMSKKLSRLMGN
jgi:hypothetical protein